MSAQPESWESWANAWQEEDSDAPSSQQAAVALVARVRREAWQMKLVVVGEALVTLAIATLVLPLLAGRPGPFEIVTVAGALSFLLVAALFALRNRRGVWRAHAASTREFLMLARERCRRRLAGCRFALGLAAVEGLFFAAWIPWALERRVAPRGLADYLAAFAWLGLLLALVVGVTLVLRARAQHELADLERLAAELTE